VQIQTNTMLPSSPRKLPFAVVLCPNGTTANSSRGHFCIPSHMVLLHPFRDPLTYGPEICNTGRGMHLGLDSLPDSVAGMTVANGSGEFIVLSDRSFVFLLPKVDPPISLLDVMLPTSKTHTVLFGKKGKVYKLVPGSTIIAQSAKNNTFSSAAIFLTEAEHYNKITETLHWSLSHMILIHARLVTKPPSSGHPFFSPTPKLQMTEEWGLRPVCANSKRFFFLLEISLFFRVHILMNFNRNRHESILQPLSIQPSSAAACLMMSSDSPRIVAAAETMVMMAASSVSSASTRSASSPPNVSDVSSSEDPPASPNASLKRKRT